MDWSNYRHDESVEVAASPETIYDLVADISRMGEWSPVCTGGRYDDDGVWFTGTNAIGGTTWETRCRVVVAEPGREFAFVNHGLHGRHEMVRWGFTFRPLDDGTEVTESWQVLPGYADGFAEEDNPGMTLEQRLDLMKGLALRGMPATLAAIKRAAESAA